MSRILERDRKLNRDPNRMTIGSRTGCTHEQGTVRDDYKISPFVISVTLLNIITKEKSDIMVGPFLKENALKKSLIAIIQFKYYR